MPPSKQPRARVPREFYLDDPGQVARKLLGKLLVRPGITLGGAVVGRIVEVEAYFGDDDPSAHAFAGKTARNEVLFGPPGHAYVYFVYGMHYCLNVSCEPEGRAGSVLLRALEPVSGLETMAKNRGVHGLNGKPASSLTAGPARLCEAFGVTRDRDNGADFTARASELQIQDDGFEPGEIIVGPRIGISKDVDRLARFLVAGNPFVSGRKR